MTLASSTGRASGATPNALKSERWRRLAQMSIPLRLAALSAFLLAALVATNGVLIREINANSARIAAATDLFEQLEGADGASTAFGNIRYWLTDLAVSLLTISERNANEARADLKQYLDRLVAYYPAL